MIIIELNANQFEMSDVVPMPSLNLIASQKYGNKLSIETRFSIRARTPER